MTSLAQVTALVDAHVSRDHDRFRAVTLQIAANVATRSAPGADKLRKLVDKYQAAALIPLPSAHGLFFVPPHLSPFEDMVLAPSVRERLDRVVVESRRQGELFVKGLTPTRKLLFAGKPGVGKTMAAGALALAVQLPLFRVELHGVISSHLGETSAKLAKVFEHIRTMPAVYLFDEFDALGADRGSVGGDVAGAEMRRVVNSLLQFIEDDTSDGLIIAATNHVHMLDSAMFRRFDETIVFPEPSKDEVQALVSRVLPEVTIDIDAIYAYVANPHLGHADLCAALNRVRKDHVIVGTPIDTERVVDALAMRMRRPEASS